MNIGGGQTRGAQGKHPEDTEKSISHYKKLKRFLTFL